MSLQFILGSSGAGKSYCLHKEIIDKSMENPDTTYLIVVPEQFTLQTQKDLVSLHPNHGIMNIDILSFVRLAYRVFDEAGLCGRPVLDDTGKSMILRRVVSEKAGELKIFKNINKAGFIDELQSMISEFYQYSISDGELEQVRDQLVNKPMLKGKLDDILVIYRAFQDMMRERFITAEEILDILSDLLDTSGMFRDCVICLDGFTGFTPSQYKVIGKLLRLCKKVLVTVTIDPREDLSRSEEEFQLFYLSRKTIHKLENLAEEVGVAVEPPVYPVRSGTPFRFRGSRALAALEKNLFRFPWQRFEEEQRDVVIHISRTPEEEVCFAAQEITRLVRGGYCRYRDIAVVTGDLEQYGRFVKKIFPREQVPFFLDQKEGILSSPQVEMILGLIEILKKDFAYEGVFRYLKTGLAGFSRDETDRLENYVLKYGVRGYRRWNRSWLVTKEGTQIEEIRSRFMEQIRPLREKMRKKGATVSEMADALREFLELSDTMETLNQHRADFEETEEPLSSREYEAVYEGITTLLDQVSVLLGEDVISLEDFGGILETGFGEIKIGLIPSVLDQVVVGDIERTRLKSIKVLIFAGVNDGIIPKASGRGGIISDMDREILAEYQLEMAPTRRQAAYTEQFYLYLNMTKPSEKLYLTFSQVGSDGKSLRPSYLIHKLEQVFTRLTAGESMEKSGTEAALARERGFSYLVNGLKEYSGAVPEDDLWRELYAWYIRSGRQEDLRRMIQGVFYRNEVKPLSPEAVDLLYGNCLEGSVTRLEKYAGCPFAHFMAYGLKLNERPEYVVEAVDFGNILHESIEQFGRRIEAEGLRWSGLTDEERDRLAVESVREVTGRYENQIFFQNHRTAYLAGRMEQTMKRTAWALCEHVKRGEFAPAEYELVFRGEDGAQYELEEGKQMRLQGKIDRVDVKESADSIHVKIIDYKTGRTAFDLSSLFHGLQLQLVVYMKQAMAYEKKKHPDKEVVPAGIFYYHVDDPIVETNGEAPGEDALLKEVRMSGLANGSEEVILEMDRTLAAEDGTGVKASAKSLLFPVETDRSGKIGKRSHVADSETFQDIVRFADRKVKELGESIMEGKADISPYQYNGRTACDYCPYRSVCGFDRKSGKNRYRTLKKADMEEMKKKMEEAKGWEKSNGPENSVR
ncbi:helicase-exonuclease AddAB subunit AddB [Anaerolentibacter hominis]|uniref:helicase-exonuclease AddAB subunit AddB n=1 Tax=Anaerolentibacter hominis TaxID=3079009 RepID=UPI0031B853EF